MFALTIFFYFPAQHITVVSTMSLFYPADIGEGTTSHLYIKMEL